MLEYRTECLEEEFVRSAWKEHILMETGMNKRQLVKVLSQIENLILQAIFKIADAAIGMAEKWIEICDDDERILVKRS